LYTIYSFNGGSMGQMFFIFYFVVLTCIAGLILLSGV
jgi:hypothetical protein